MDAITAITEDHRLLEGLFVRLTSGDGKRNELLEEVRVRLAAHSAAEEVHVYDAIERQAKNGAEEVRHGIAAHREAEELLAAATDLAGEATFQDAVERFVQAVKHHIEEEESEILPSLKSFASEQELNRLGEIFEQRRMAELNEGAGSRTG